MSEGADAQPERAGARSGYDIQPGLPDRPVDAAAARAVAAHPPRLWERVLAATTHLLMLASVPGLAVAVLIWLTQRRRSAYIARQAKDAVLWQLLSNLVFLLLLGILLVVVAVSLGGAVSNTQQASGGVTRLVGSLLGIYVVLVLAALIFVVSAVVGAIFAFLGLTFHYPFVSRRRKRE